MKLTEEQKKAIQCLKETLGYPVVSDGTFENNHYVDRKEYVGISDEVYLDGINEVIERVEGIQWQAYPENEPKAGVFYDVLTKRRMRVMDVVFEGDYWYDKENDSAYNLDHIAYFATINLPTKKV